jgi:hypothetical protein
MNDRLSPLDTRLAGLDAAPRTEPTAAERDREETLLRTILDDTAPPGRSARPATGRARRVSFTLAGALAAGLALLTATGGLSNLPGLAPHGPLSATELASWTGTPSSLGSAGAQGSAAEQECLEATEEYGPGPAVVSNADVRGDVASMVVTRGDRPVYCMAGSEGGRSTMGISPVPDLPADSIELDTSGSRGAGASRLNYIVGFAGSDVEKITVRDSGHTVRATIQDGRWTAWWPGGDYYGRHTGTITLTFTDGTTRTMKGEELSSRPADGE